MRRFAAPVTASFLVVGGFVFGEFVREVRPVGYLIRPLLAAVALALLVGGLAILLPRGRVLVAVAVAVWVIQPGSRYAIVLAGVVASTIAWRLLKGRFPDFDVSVLTASGVFFAAGLIPVIPLLSWSSPAEAFISHDGPPQYAILLDGYPRADSLADHGVDISEFLTALEDRGFDLYPQATAELPRTFQLLGQITGGAGEWRERAVAFNREVRDSWRLPSGWVTVSPPMGFVTLPHAPTLNPGGFTHFEERLLARSAFRRLAADWIMDGYRYELNRAFDVIASTDAKRVFAHIFAPHFPVLYAADGEPSPMLSCWPLRCLAIDPWPVDISADERAQLIGGFAEWLNGRLLELVDEILAGRPNAEIVLFSDHGGRWDTDESEEWRRTFLASHTPSRPDLFEGSPHPKDVLELLQRDA